MPDDVPRDGAATITLRLAAAADAPALGRLVEHAFRALCVRDYAAAAVADAAGSAMRFDAGLLERGRVFVAEDGGRIVAAAAWTREHAALLAPDFAIDVDSAVVRNVCTDPGHAGRGLARRLVQCCHADAASAGCRDAWLLATLTGAPLYRRLGYRLVAERTVVTPGGHAMRALLMTRRLARAADAA